MQRNSHHRLARAAAVHHRAQYGAVIAPMTPAHFGGLGNGRLPRHRIANHELREVGREDIRHDDHEVRIARELEQRPREAGRRHQTADARLLSCPAVPRAPDVASVIMVPPPCEVARERAS
jgi:hypothetical protein